MLSLIKRPITCKQFLALLVWVLLFGIQNAQAVEVNRGAIVLLIAKGTSGEVISTGTGFIADPSGKVVTNYHVLVDASTMEAVFENGRRVNIKGIRAFDRTKDFSILQLEGDLYSTLELGTSKTLKEFDYTTALGFPSQGVETTPQGGRGLLVQTYGFLLGMHPQAFPEFPFIYTTAPFSPGFSGGPLVDKQNRVVGIATVEGRAINLALPIDPVIRHLDSKELITFSKLLEQDRNAKEALYYRGNFALYADGNPDEAIRLFQQILKTDPAFIPARYDLAVAFRGQGDIDRAIAEYERVLELNPYFPEALSNVGGQYFRKGDIDQAIHFFKRAIKAYPNFVQALSNLGAALNKQGKHKDALPHLKKATRLNPEFGITYFNLGNALFALNQWDEAEEAYNSGVKMGVDYLSIHWKLFEIHMKKNRKDAAIKELNLILEMDPMNKEASDKLKSLKGT